jgi:hypothetical protein
MFTIVHDHGQQLFFTTDLRRTTPIRIVFRDIPCPSVVNLPASSVLCLLSSVLCLLSSVLLYHQFAYITGLDGDDLDDIFLFGGFDFDIHRG